MSKKSKEKKPKKFVEELPVKLSSSEYETQAELLAKQITVVAELEAAKKQIVKDFADRILIAEREKESLRKAVETHTVLKQVECIEKFNYEQNRATVIRLDTNDVVRERALSGEERDQLAQGDFLDEEIPNGEQKQPRA